MNALEYEFRKLPQPPFHIYFIEGDGQISPKRIFVVTRKRLNMKNESIELYILEFGKFITYDEQRVVLVSEFYVN